MRALLVVLPHEVVHEERLATARRTQYELVTVRGDAPLHRQVTDVEVQRFPVSLSTILMPKGARRAAIVGFLREEAHTACSMKVWKLSSAGKSAALPGIAAQ